MTGGQRMRHVRRMRERAAQGFLQQQQAKTEVKRGSKSSKKKTRQRSKGAHRKRAY